ncbi:MAG: FHA domain-containing protein [Planctomycetaceae bacterium]|nr:FHA domain-containing protein [Planctomycetaceae bacterium]
MFGELVPQGGGDPIPLLKVKLLVGRRDGCDIALRFPNVSSRHCELEMREGYWLVRDLNSSNGTKVNGVRVRSKWILPGDELAVAKHRFKIDYTVAPDAPPPPPLAENDEIPGQSLMEKAGLVRRRATSAPSVPPDRKSPPPDLGTNPANDEERVFEWLEEDDEI